MTDQKSRRDFLRLSALGLASAATGEFFSGITRPAVSAGNPLTIYTSGPSQQMMTPEPISWHPISGIVGADTVVVDANQKFQSVLGFGAAFTDASCYTFNKMDGTGKAKLLHELFSPSELGLNVCRTCVGSSDYSTKAYSYDDSETPDPSLSKFSIAHDEEYIIPSLKQARELNPDLFLFSTPWSPPGWMKSNHSLLGGNMRREYMPAYADYFVKFLQRYAAAGVPIQAVSVQNEVDTDQDGRMPACSWPQEYEADFVRNFLGPAIEKQGLKTQVWVIDHNYNLWGRALGELETPDFRKYCKSVAWHGYVGDPGWMTRVHDAMPDVDMFWTEGGPDYTDPKYLTNWSDWGKTFTGIMRNWCRSLTAWNLALDENGKPNIGPFPCGGLVTVNSKSLEITRSGQYWAIAHFSKFIKRGAYRIGSESKSKDFYHVVFENPDKSKVAVITNPGAARTASIQVGGMIAEIAVGADSVTTVVWS